MGEAFICCECGQEKPIEQRCPYYEIDICTPCNELSVIEEDVEEAVAHQAKPSESGAEAEEK